MARLSTKFDVNMAYSPRGTHLFYADRDLIVMFDDDWNETYCIGDFKLSGNVWTGTVERIVLMGSTVISDLKLPARYVLPGVDRETTYSHALSGDDLIYGSIYRDRLIGFDGDDRMSGKAGADIMNGGNGKDTLFGGSGDDRLSGSYGRDRLEGGNGNDKLFGGRYSDVFAFDGADGRDRIYDFRNGADRIEITDGASRFSQLDVTRDGDDVRIAFDDTVIILEDTQVREIGAGDFIF